MERYQSPSSTPIHLDHPKTSRTTKHEYHAHVSPPTRLTGQVPHISHNHISHTHHIPVQPIQAPLPLQIHHVPILPSTPPPRLPILQEEHERRQENIGLLSSKTHRNHLTQTVQSCQLVRGNLHDNIDPLGTHQHNSSY